MQQTVSLLQILLLAQHVSGTIMPIIRSSRLLYRWLLPVVFGAVVFKLLVCCGAEVYVSGLQDAAASGRLKFLEHSGPVEACLGIALAFMSY